MIFRQLFDHETYTYTYLVASGIGREAVLIDPVKEQLPLYQQLLNELDVKLMFAIDTHVHADHITALGDLRTHTDCVTVMGEQTSAECVSLKVKEGELILIDNLVLKPIYTPGHTDDSYSFVMDDRVFTGDTLLIRGSGRTDFQNGDSAMQYDSIFNKLLRLPNHTIVYPAHDYRGMTSSTIGEEQRFNPRLQVRSKAEYIELMANLKLPNPKYMDIAVPANQHCGNIS
jgi:glyoxylase-like metal-dependent hydrolase (beta-lactamase superfamily II)